MAATVAILGTGNMGSAAAERLASRGFRVVLWNRTREKAEALAERIGAQVASTAFEAVQESQYALIFLADEDSIFTVLSGFHRMDGVVVVDHATITPHGARRISGFIEALGGCYVEAPIVAGPRVVKRGEATIIVAGREHCIGLAQPILSSLASRIIEVGDDPSKAAALKLAFNSLLIGTIELLSEALVLAESYGVGKEKLREVLEGTVFTGIAGKYIDRVTGLVDGKASFRLILAEKDLDYALRAGHEHRVPMPAVSGALAMYRIAVRLGYGGEDYTRVYHVVKGKKV